MARAKSTSGGSSSSSAKHSFFDYLVMIFLATHIPITLLIDGQAFLPSSIYPQAIKDLLATYVSHFKDPIMGVDARPAWLVWIIGAELMLQVPYFVLALYAWYHKHETLMFLNLPLRDATIAYGAHTATTLLPILGTFLTTKGLTDMERYILVAIYSPYLIMPLAMMINALRTPAGSSKKSA